MAKKYMAAVNFEHGEKDKKVLKAKKGDPVEYNEHLLKKGLIVEASEEKVLVPASGDQKPETKPQDPHADDKK
jgi:hypothetical protein